MIAVQQTKTIQAAGIDLISYQRKNSIPRRWADLTRDQVIAITKIIMLYQKPFGEYTDHMKFTILNILLGWSPEKFHRLTDLQIVYLLRQVQALFDDDAPCYPALKYIRYGWHHYYLPGYMLEKLTAIEFAMCEEYYINIINNVELTHNLNLLTATLVQKHNLKGQRVEYDTETSTNMAGQFDGKNKRRAVSYVERFAVYHYYFACRQALIKKYTAVWRKGGTGYSSSRADFTSKYNFVGIIHSVAENGVFGNWDQTSKTNLHNLLHYLNYNGDKMKEHELNNRRK